MQRWTSYVSSAEQFPVFTTTKSSIIVSINSSISISICSRSIIIIIIIIIVIIVIIVIISICSSSSSISSISSRISSSYSTSGSALHTSTEDRCLTVLPVLLVD